MASKDHKRAIFYQLAKTTQNRSLSKNYTTSNLTAGVLDLFLGISEVKIGFVGFVGLGISQHQQF